MKKNPIFKFFASLKLAVISLLSLAGILAVATFLERDFGMRAVHLMVYGTPWFYGVLLLLGINVLCAALSRYPWKPHQTGFVVTHLGIITILIGAWLTQRYGVDGSLPIRQSAASGKVLLSDMVLQFYDEKSLEKAESAPILEIPVPESGKRRDGELLKVALSPDQTFIVDAFVPRLVQDKKVEPSPIDGVGLGAIKVNLVSSRFTTANWLKLNENPNKAGEVNFGPAKMTFRRVWNEKELAEFLSAKAKPVEEKPSPGLLAVNFDGKGYRIDIGDAMKAWQPLGKTGFEVKVEEYLPHAIVEKNKLVSKSKEPLNPAVQLFARNKEGDSEKHVVFANFPEFNTRYHGKDKTKKAFGLDFRMVAGAHGQDSLAIVGRSRGKLEIVLGPDGKKLFYRSYGAKGNQTGVGPVALKTKIPTGWMDATFEIEEFYPTSVEVKSPRYIEYIASGEANYLSGVRYRMQTARDTAGNTKSPENWLYEGESIPFPMGKEIWRVVYTKKALILPFVIHLDKFTVGNDPGTTKAATYESEVRVMPSLQERKTLGSALISMNEPLTYGGYTFYQSSYQMEEGKPPVSIFSVNWDPGRVIKYLGSLIMCLGIAIMFWMNPHYWGKVFGRKPQ